MAGKTKRTTKASAKTKKPARKKAPTKKQIAERAKRQRDLLALLLVTVGVFIGVAVFPYHWLSDGAGSWFPSGNPMGLVGGALQTLLFAGLGAGTLAVPIGFFLAGAGVGQWWSPAITKRLSIATVGAGILLPLAYHLAGAPAGWGGSLGAFLGEPIRQVIGWLGGWLVVGGGVILVSVLAFDFNPLNILGRGTVWFTRLLGQGGASAKEKTKGWMAERQARLEEERRLAEEAEAARAHREPYDGMVETLEDAPEDEVPPPVEVEPETDILEDVVETPPEEAVVPSADLIPEEDIPVVDHPLPGLELLTQPEYGNRAGMERELDRLGHVLVEKLETFNVKCSLGGRTTGPVVTQYEVVPAPGVKVNRIANLDADLALAMKARSIRIVAPIPGKGAVGVEIPNPKAEVVRLRAILEAPDFRRSRGILPLALGKDLTGHPFVSDLAKMPHALIAGATGSGKSVCLNTIITSLVYKHGPDSLRLLLIDPKMVELSAYSDLPHLRHPVVTDPKDAAGVLKWAVMEMERRYALLSANGVRSLGEFNQRVAGGVVLKRAEAKGPEGDEDRWIYNDGPLPYIVVVVDELADLMMTVQAEVEKPLTQLAQKARAIGIHLIVATQRPSVNVITGLIKANFPCRIAFRVASKTDSRTILDQNGADSLLGHGDMLFLPPGQSEAVRMQGAFISTEETEAMMTWYREQADTLEALKARVSNREEDILEEIRAMEGGDEEGGGAIQGDWDELFKDAAEVCIQQGAGSTSLLQRRLRIGYGRAARIVDQLHDAGVLGPPDGSKPREVLIGMDVLYEMFS